MLACVRVCACVCVCVCVEGGYWGKPRRPGQGAELSLGENKAHIEYVCVCVRERAAKI